MNETLPLIDETVPEVDLQWQQLLDELVRGECSEDTFIGHVQNLREASPYTAWNVIALLDQRYRRGQLPAEVFRSIESKIAQYELADIDYGTTIDLIPAVATPSPTAKQDAASPQAAAPSAQAAEPSAQAADPNPQAAVSTAPPASAERPARAVPEIGLVLRDRYVIERRLGTGGMGTVFKALDHYRGDLPEGDRHVAMKFLHPRISGGPEILSVLRREFYCAQALSHPNIVKVYDLDRDDGFVFFTMEFLEGELLSGVIERLNPRKISRSSAWTLIQGMAAGLAHAHFRNVVHADFKPHNIMITSLGEVRILDFGAASSRDPQAPSAEANQKGNSTALTPAYASCELLDSKPADPRDDLYALACVAYELLAGEHPFQRRRSTEARDLGLVARRPEGLTQGQWKTLALGLSWRREDRSIAVADWLAQLTLPADTPNRVAVPLGLHSAAEPPKSTEVPMSVAAPEPTPASTSMPTPKLVPVLKSVLPSKSAPAPKAVPAPTSVPVPKAAPVTKSTPDPKSAPEPKSAPDPKSASVPKSVSVPVTKSASVSRPAAAANATSTLLGVVAALAVVMLAFGLWLSLTRRSIEAGPLPTSAAQQSPANSPISPDVFAPRSLSQPLPSGPALSEYHPASADDSSTMDAPAKGVQTFSASQPAKSDTADTAPHKARTNSISLSGSSYRVRSRQNFAELHVRRAPGSPGSTSFTWWTEPASAAAGVDYVPQGRITQLLPAGTRAASLFIRLLPNASRKHSAVFYVNIGEPGNGASLGRAARTAVILPPS